METKIKNIAVVDDMLENREAAVKAIREFMPLVTVRGFSSAEEIINELRVGPTDIDFVFTDMNMEEKHSGYQVAVMAWSWNIPTIVVSGGHKDHGSNVVRVGHCSPASFYGNKDNPEIWKRILEAIFCGDRNAVIATLSHGKNKEPDLENGKICGIISVPSGCMFS